MRMYVHINTQRFQSEMYNLFTADAFPLFSVVYFLPSFLPAYN